MRAVGVQEPVPHQERLDAMKDELDHLRRQIDAARSYVEDRRHLPDRRKTPRAFTGPDRRRARH